MIEIQPYQQPDYLCSVASLRMVLRYYGMDVPEKLVKELINPDLDGSAEANKILDAAKKLGLEGYIIDNGEIDDLENLVKDGIPPIVDYFLEEDGHYSPVVDVNDVNVTVQDPAYGKLTVYRRNVFRRIWFDFPGDNMETKDDLILRRYITLYPIKKERYIKDS